MHPVLPFQGKLSVDSLIRGPLVRGIAGMGLVAVLVDCSSDHQNELATHCAGHYNGTLNVTFAQGPRLISDRYAINISIDGDDIVRITGEPGGSFLRGVVNAGKFEIADDSVVTTYGGTTCIGSQTISGTLNSGLLRGKLSASLACNGSAGAPAPVSAHGLMTASKARFCSRIVTAGEWETGRARTLFRLMDAAGAGPANPGGKLRGPFNRKAYVSMSRERHRLD